ncbi:hypothetical protein [Pedobacter xixiisoli]|uniref:Uncharacterized protein n=1 Tax=Pedobacter xixiisoli TaxID=1476464 RepID=A0A285ZWD3_9SPHI|nr:hypothetical protein [Pedobacter xixiisoli]SOD13954.1 hypothetical protein SAMN06297358_1326 [Pedobacter xixiisoli]
MAEQFEYFRLQLLNNFPEYLLLADFKDNETLLLMVKPFLPLDQVMAEICDDILDKKFPPAPGYPPVQLWNK